jgi:tetratricopeptide (TPR) repeat protein
MRPRLLRASARLLALAATTVAFGACAGATPAPADPLDAIRSRAADPAADGETVAHLLLDELVAPGGTAERAKGARKRLDAMGGDAQKGLFASLARAIDDEIHGHFRSAATAHLDAIVAARTSPLPDAPLIAWYAANHLLNLRAGVADLWATARPVVQYTLDHPGQIGWRARGELVEWWSLDGFRDGGGAEEAKALAEDAKTSSDAAKKDAKDAKDSKDPAVVAEAAKPPEARSGVLEAAARRYGCAEKARMAGPFGHFSPSDHSRHFEAERSGPWPAVFAKDPLRQAPPRVVAVDRTGCALRASGASDGGIFYVETFLDLPADREAIIAVQGALAVFVDDVEVMTRDTRQWGVWPRFGSRLRLEKGRHRIVARVAGGETSIRIVANDGMPLGVPTSDDPAPPYLLTPPEILDDPNLLTPFLTAEGVPRQPGAPRFAFPRDTRDPVTRLLAAYAAHIEGQDDVSSVLIEPLIKEQEKATGPALGFQAMFLEKDPIFPQSDGRDLQKDVRSRAIAKDAELWWPRFWQALDDADKAGMGEVAPKLVELADHFREVPDILKGLALIYGKIGWKVERDKAIKDIAARFPDDAEALGGLLRLYDEEGRVDEADKVAIRIRKIDPDAEVDFERAVSRRDFRAAIKELERLRSVRKDRRDIAARIADMLTRAGLTRESMKKLEAAVQRKPDDAQARLALADARFSGGDRGSLREGLVSAIQSGADTTPLREAIELVDGITELSPYRIDGKKIIAEYEASKAEMPGTAARVLDYSAIWVHPDGSARMLEHEIIGIQSREGIATHAEQPLPRGMVLKIRTIKHDGQVLEPEIVEGKQTVTMPHLEVGDYIETETVTTMRNDGHGGQHFEGPRWFFREEKIPYWRSEFIVISPKNKHLDVETGGNVPKPDVSESGALAIRRWRVDLSPALPEEPASAPIQEFLPNVRIGWGTSLDDTIARLVDAASDETPRDPRLLRVVEGILQNKPGDEKGKAVEKGKTPVAAAAEALAAAPLSTDEKARRIYRWVLSNVEQGRESDGRRIVIGKSGNRTEAFLHLCRLAGIEASLGLVRDRLAPPAIGPMSDAESFGAIAVRVTTETGPRWMVVRDKFAPYGYMPSSLRGQPAVVLKPGAPRETTSNEGSSDAVIHKGTVTLGSDGSATLDIVQRYEGKLAILLRTALETLPDARLKETVEARLLPQSLPGARVISVEVKNLSDIDQPLELGMKLEMSSFARSQGKELLVPPPFPMQLAKLAQLPSRETPLYISEQLATRVELQLRVKLPAGAKVTTALEPASVENDGRTAWVKDRSEQGALVFDRVVDIPAGRVKVEDYAKFQAFAQRADALLHRDVVVSLEK